jgi:hypothetical protein
MLIFDENSKPIIVDGLHTPLLSEYFYVLDLNLMDFTLTPLNVLEETVAPTITLSIEGFDFNVPANWNILIVDDETMQLDVTEIADIAGTEFKAFGYGFDNVNFDSYLINVHNYFTQYPNYGPSLSKNQMLCHPISQTRWINIAPSDTYNKYLKNKLAGDLI